MLDQQIPEQLGSSSRRCASASTACQSRLRNWDDAGRDSLRRASSTCKPETGPFRHTRIKLPRVTWRIAPTASRLPNQGRTLDFVVDRNTATVILSLLLGDQRTNRAQAPRPRGRCRTFRSSNGILYAGWHPRAASQSRRSVEGPLEDSRSHFRMSSTITMHRKRHFYYFKIQNPGEQSDTRRGNDTIWSTQKIGTYRIIRHACLDPAIAFTCHRKIFRTMDCVAHKSRQRQLQTARPF